MSGIRHIGSKGDPVSAGASQMSRWGLKPLQAIKNRPKLRLAAPARLIRGEEFRRSGGRGGGADGSGGGRLERQGQEQDPELLAESARSLERI